MKRMKRETLKRKLERELKEGRIDHKGYRKLVRMILFGRALARI